LLLLLLLLLLSVVSSVGRRLLVAFDVETLRCGWLLCAEPGGEGKPRREMLRRLAARTTTTSLTAGADADAGSDADADAVGCWWFVRWLLFVFSETAVLLSSAETAGTADLGGGLSQLSSILSTPSTTSLTAEDGTGFHFFYFCC